MSQVHPIEEQVASFLADKQVGRGNIGSAWSSTFYRNSVEILFLPWALAHGLTDGHDITVGLWNAYKDELLGRELAEQSVLTYLRGAKIFLRSLDLPVTLLAKLQMFKAAKPMLEILTREEIDRLEALAATERDKLIVRVLANTGIRLSEMTGLKAKDLHEVTSPKRYCRLRVWGKGSKEREVPVDRDTYKRLEALAKAGGKRTFIFPAMQHDRKTGELVMMDGPRLSNNAVDKMFRELKKAAKITKPCTPHKLRHAFATWALQQGMPISQLQLILGHSDLTMIVKVYQHLVPDDMSREYERLFGNVAVATEESKKRRRIA